MSQDDKIDALISKVDSIHTAIVGNDMGTTGIAKRLEKVENYQGKDKKQKWVALGFVTAIGSILKWWDKIFQ